jgi:hypothetical protein
MANSLYDKARQRFLTGAANWLTDTIKVVMVDTANYTFLPSHEFLSSIPANARISAAVTLTDKTATNGAADAKDATFTAITGESIEALVVYADVNGSDAESLLIAYIDSATGLPITPNGGDIIVTWDNGVNKIFRI